MGLGCFVLVKKLVVLKKKNQLDVDCSEVLFDMYFFCFCILLDSKCRNTC